MLYDEDHHFLKACEKVHDEDDQPIGLELVQVLEVSWKLKSKELCQLQPLEAQLVRGPLKIWKSTSAREDVSLPWQPTQLQANFAQEYLP